MAVGVKEGEGATFRAASDVRVGAVGRLEEMQEQAFHLLDWVLVA
jgi:hypothetical protein